MVRFQLESLLKPHHSFVYALYTSFVFRCFIAITVLNTFLEFHVSLCVCLLHHLCEQSYMHIRLNYISDYKTNEVSTNAEFIHDQSFLFRIAFR
jgi:hypothetical protein